MRLSRDDDGSMALAMLVVVVSAGLSTVLAAIVSFSLVGSRADIQTVRAVDAAHAGLNVGLARVMQLGVAPIGADDCVLDGPAGNGHYHVTLSFYAADPATGVCAFDATKDRYAQILSAGSDGQGGRTRTLVGTYAFPLGAADRPPGGRLVYADAAGDTCVTAAFVLAGCDPAASAQTFVYGADLTLAQVDVATLVARCVAVSAGALAMRQCDPAASTQHWLFNGRTFTTPDGASCIDSLGGRSAAVLLGAGTRCTAATGTRPTWTPDAPVGAGYAASAAAHEIVNGAYFGTCLSTSATVVPCGQVAFSPGTTGPWIFKSVDDTYSTISSGTNCLSTTTTPPAAPQIRTCVAGDVTQQWTAPAVSSTWGASFRIQDRGDHCLAAMAVPADPYTATVTVTTCSDSATQKWNVDTNAFRPGLIKIEER
ncbi:hypothetical protein [Actinoplanes sp. NPDC051411]|uniref:hypothetical protein n=1 Tax=Actinoplanes sp. NPDC051411 TaxID=3155522 RepID=UPI00343C99EE